MTPNMLFLYFFVNVNSFFVSTCQHYFGSSTHAQGTLVGIQGFGREFLTLLQHEFIEIRQYGRIEADAVFYQQNGLDAYLVDVMLQVHFVFYQLDDGYQQVGISQPAENVFERAEVFVGYAFGDAVTEGGQYHHRDVGILPFDITCHVETFVVACSRHADNEVVGYG